MKETPTSTQPASPQDKAPDSVLPEEAQHKRKKTPGERIFDRTVYTGIGFGVNEASSMVITNQFMLGKNLFEKMPALKKVGAWFSEEGYKKVGGWLAKTLKLAQKVTKDGKIETPQARGENTLLMITLISGGTLLIWPMKWLEDHKIGLVKKANHLVDKFRGNTLSPEGVRARDAEVEQHIACQPRQSWPSFLAARTVAVLSSIGVGSFVVGAQRNKEWMNASERMFTGTVLPEGTKTPAHGVRNYARLLSVETYSCLISSVVLEVASKLFARRSSKPHDPELCRKPDALAAPADTQATDNRDSKAAGATGRHTARVQSQKQETQAAQLV